MSILIPKEMFFTAYCPNKKTSESWRDWEVGVEEGIFKSNEIEILVQTNILEYL